MANEIHASGERRRKKLPAGRRAARARALWPSHKPVGSPAATASTKPAVTRKSDATRSFKSRPVLSSSTKPRATATGEGKADSGKTPAAESAAHRSEEHTSELQSRQYLVCRLLLEKKK